MQILSKKKIRKEIKELIAKSEKKKKLRKLCKILLQSLKKFLVHQVGISEASSTAAK